ncbi:MerR family transcriptional regulator [Sphingomonas sp.]|uniref:MerR family transcriptional regulator n=1 Tax=Sphingomonas sp. TaxID=28214 RepID=UPI00185BA435|nr:MerR family transcriptional regulator [Sphingomonas sp.]MBA3512571.1 MerR family transcriptional regulator [Sphingomonas sp.]
MATAEKAAGAFKTIGELSQELGVAQHILRYWETKFPQLKPLQRAGNRRYYRPADVDLARRIHRLLSQDGYTVRGVQKLLRDRMGSSESPPATTPAAAAAQPVPSTAPEQPSGGVEVTRLVALRDRLARALDE